MVKTGPDGSLRFGLSRGYIAPDEVMDAEEFFQAKRDEHFGRWRYPLEPTLVVYADTETVKVFDEKTGRTVAYYRDDWPTNQPPEETRLARDAANAYLEAHPERPAAEAKVGEIWELVIDDGSEHTVFVHADRTMGGRDGVSAGGAYFDIDDVSNVVSARKVWGPEDAS